MKYVVFLLLFGLLLVGVWMSPVPAQQQGQKHPLVTAIPGVFDNASNDWARTAAFLLPTKERYAIELNGAQPSPRLSDIPPDHVFFVSDTDPQGLKAIVRAIAASESVTVIVDMPLNGITGTGLVTGWDRQTQFAGQVAGMLATAHKESYDDAYNVLIGHSAGAEPIPIAQSFGGQNPFDFSIAASPRCPGGQCTFAQNTLIITADDDFGPSPGGSVPPATLIGAAGEAEAGGWAMQGYSVLRVVAPNGSDGSQNVPTAAATMAVQGMSKVTVGPVAGERVALVPDQSNSHAVTHDLWHPDRTVARYSAGSSTPVEIIKGTSLGKVIKDSSMMPANATPRTIASTVPPKTHTAPATPPNTSKTYGPAGPTTTSTQASTPSARSTTNNNARTPPSTPAPPSAQAPAPSAPPGLPPTRNTPSSPRIPTATTNTPPKLEIIPSSCYKNGVYWHTACWSSDGMTVTDPLPPDQSYIKSLSQIVRVSGVSGPLTAGAPVTPNVSYGAAGPITRGTSAMTTSTAVPSHSTAATTPSTLTSDGTAPVTTSTQASTQNALFNTHSSIGTPPSTPATPRSAQAPAPSAPSTPTPSSTTPIQVQVTPIQVQVTPIQAKAIPVRTKAMPLQVQTPLQVQPAPVHIQSAPAQVQSPQVHIQPAPVHIQSAPAQVQPAPVYYTPPPKLK